MMMACASPALMNSVISPKASIFSPSPRFFSSRQVALKTHPSKLFKVRASAAEDADCNEEECAPEKEVGKVSMEWLAGDKTKVLGTFPPKKKGWTGYIEKDTAGQTNIYSVEPTVYISESVISSGTAGSSSDGAENTAALVFGVALIALASASSILLQVGKNEPQIPTIPYSGPSLSYYIDKFKPTEIVPVSAPSVVEEETVVSSTPEPDSPVPEVEAAASEEVKTESST